MGEEAQKKNRFFYYKSDFNIRYQIPINIKERGYYIFYNVAYNVIFKLGEMQMGV